VRAIGQTRNCIGIDLYKPTLKDYVRYGYKEKEKEKTQYIIKALLILIIQLIKSIALKKEKDMYLYK